MNKQTLIIVLVMCLVTAFITAVPVQAHVLLSDTRGEVGAILHVSPDDDPIAGQSSILFFDIQKDISAVESNDIQLTITDSTGQKTTAPVTKQGSYISSAYTFPSQAAYEIHLSIPQQHTTLEFTAIQRVSRGISTDRVAHEAIWAKTALVMGICSIAVACILAFNHRKAF